MVFRDKTTMVEEEVRRIPGTSVHCPSTNARCPRHKEAWRSIHSRIHRHRHSVRVLCHTGWTVLCRKMSKAHNLRIPHPEFRSLKTWTSTHDSLPQLQSPTPCMLQQRLKKRWIVLGLVNSLQASKCHKKVRGYYSIGVALEISWGRGCCAWGTEKPSFVLHKWTNASSITGAWKDFGSRDALFSTETCTLFLIALPNCMTGHLLGVQIATPPSGLLAASEWASVLGKGTFLAACWLITCAAPSHSLILSSQQPFPLLPTHLPTKPWLPSIPGQELDAGPGRSRGSLCWCLSHSKWSEG